VQLSDHKWQGQQLCAKLTSIRQILLVFHIQSWTKITQYKHNHKLTTPITRRQTKIWQHTCHVCKWQDGSIQKENWFGGWLRLIVNVENSNEMKVKLNCWGLRRSTKENEREPIDGWGVATLNKGK